MASEPQVTQGGERASTTRPTAFIRWYPEVGWAASTHPTGSYLGSWIGTDGTDFAAVVASLPEYRILVDALDAASRLEREMIGDFPGDAATRWFYPTEWVTLTRPVNLLANLLEAERQIAFHEPKSHEGADPAWRHHAIMLGMWRTSAQAWRDEIAWEQSRRTTPIG